MVMKKFTLLSSLVLLSFIVYPQKIVLHCGRLIDVKSGKVLENVTVIIDGNKITEVTNGYVNKSAADKAVDLKNKTVMPGLMDMHVHVEHETKKGATADRFTMNPSDIAFESVKYANVTLMAGFTTVRDLGGTGVNISLRNAINKRLIAGPRIYTAGKSIATTGGHADPTNGYRKDLMGDPGPVEGVVKWTAGGKKSYTPAL